MLRCVNVHKAYRRGGSEVPVLRGVSLEIPDAGFYAVMGASGSGKSTLLHLIGALDTPDAGEIHANGRAVHSLSESEAVQYRRREIGIIFQQFNLIATLTARENVELPGMLAGDDPAWLHSRSSALLERLGLTPRSEHRPDALSGGEQQRVAIARSLLYSPKLILADEPTGNLDSASAQRLWDLLGELAQEQGMLVLMVTHEPAAAARCRRVYFLRDGQLAGDLETEGLDAAGVAARYQQSVGAA